MGNNHEKASSKLMSRDRFRIPFMPLSYAHLKRSFDLLGVLLFSPLALVLIFLSYIAIKIETRGPAFFVQERPGYKGKLFKIYKLRTMIVETHKDGELLSDFEHMTKTGAIIRKLSLDELPQLLNVLLGQMSFIGPRPLLPQYLPLYSKEQMRRHDVLPGITGWAQVNGRNESTWEEKFERDVWYVDHQCLRLDMKIFVMTIINVLGRKGINAGVNETMDVFTGTRHE
ncbi:MAG: sugar transferase [Bacillota bacterium]|nr:sugar transferase [Bacillota bacterium]